MKQTLPDVFIVASEQAQFAPFELVSLTLESALLSARKRVFGDVLVGLLQFMLVPEQGIDFAVELLVALLSRARGIDVTQNLLGVMNALGAVPFFPNS
jgi:hypothetical protein